MSKIMIGCRIDPEIKTVLESTSSLLGVSESKIIHDAVLTYLGVPQEKTPLNRIEQVEKSINELVQKCDRLSRLLED